MIDAQTGSGCVGRVVARCMDAPASSMRLKFGNRPAATAGDMTSNDAPSRQRSTTRGCSVGGAVTVAGARTDIDGPTPDPRIHSGPTMDRMVATVKRVATTVRRRRYAAV